MKRTFVQVEMTPRQKELIKALAKKELRSMGSLFLLALYEKYPDLKHE